MHLHIWTCPSLNPYNPYLHRFLHIAMGSVFVRVSIVDYIYMHTHCTVWSPHNNTLYLKICSHFTAALCSPLFNSIQLSIAPAQPDLSVEMHRLVCTYTDNVCIRIYTPLHLHTQGHTLSISSEMCTHTHTHLVRDWHRCSGAQRETHKQCCTPGYTCTYMFYRVHCYRNASSPFPSDASI